MNVINTVGDAMRSVLRGNRVVEKKTLLAKRKKILVVTNRCDYHCGDAVVAVVIVGNKQRASKQ